MDHGFSEVISKNKVFELHEKFFKLSFQAAKCKLAGGCTRHLIIKTQVIWKKTEHYLKKFVATPVKLSFSFPSWFICTKD